MATAQLVRREARISVRKDGTLRLAAVADTHSRPHPAAGAHLEKLRPDAILHAGDIGDLAVLDRLGQVAPVFAVRGNIDTRADGLPDVLLVDVHTDGDGERDPGASAGERRGKLRILVIHIAVAGPRLRGEVARMARAEGASLIVCGHSHVPFMGRDRDLTFFNPGSLGPRRFHLPILFGTIEITSSRVELFHFDCETGQRWTPPQ